MLLSKIPPTSAPAAYPSIDPATAQRMFQDLAVDLTRSDAELTSAVRAGNRVGAGWDSWFKGAANRMLDAQEAYRMLVPHDVDLAARLRNGAVDLAASSGQLYSAYQDGDTFGAGWDRTLDPKIDLVREATDRLFRGPGPAPGPYPGPHPAPAPGRPYPAPGVPGAAQQDAAQAVDLVRQSMDAIRRVPTDDRGDASTKDARLAAHGLNMQAQGLIERHFQGPDATLASRLRRADAHLEDANWQLARKPSPDGRFNGVDIPGALRDSESALSVLEQVARGNG